jgi:hypothetical protein
MGSSSILKKKDEKKSPPKPPPDDSDPKVLTMYMLSAGFTLWACTVVLACFIFVYEHIVKHISDKIEKKREDFYKANIENCKTCKVIISNDLNTEFID